MNRPQSWLLYHRRRCRRSPRFRFSSSRSSSLSPRGDIVAAAHSRLAVSLFLPLSEALISQTPSCSLRVSFYQISTTPDQIVFICLSVVTRLSHVSMHLCAPHATLSTPHSTHDCETVACVCDSSHAHVARLIDGRLGKGCEGGGKEPPLQCHPPCSRVSPYVRGCVHNPLRYGALSSLPAHNSICRSGSPSSPKSTLPPRNPSSPRNRRPRRPCTISRFNQVPPTKCPLGLLGRPHLLPSHRSCCCLRS